MTTIARIVKAWTLARSDADLEQGPDGKPHRYTSGFRRASKNTPDLSVYGEPSKSKFVRLMVALGFMQQRVVFSRISALPDEFIHIPAGREVEGEIFTDMPVVVAGTFIGGLNVRGNATIEVLEGAIVRDGLLSADTVELKGVARNSSIDVGTVRIAVTGAILGDSQTYYARLEKDPEAEINGRVGRRVRPRDGMSNVPRSTTYLSEN